jgi:3,4-dihydroxy-9,10-secoandrosta-1,3,5(10)-triene-9,17-dione 4,5-dioxygenase
MSEVSTLGYVVISAKDPQAWKGYAEGCLGMAEASAPDGGVDRETVYFRTDERSWRLAVEPGDDGGVVALGFEVPGRDQFEQLIAKLEGAGVAVKDAPDVATQRRVSALVQVSDPNGIPLEFFYGAKVEKENFVSPRAARFVTGVQGFGHAVITANDLDETYAFYIDLLGFRLSDIIAIGPVELHFTSPSPRHHSLAFVAFPGGPGGMLQHIMVEVDDLDTVGRALDRCVDSGVTIQNSLGKHTNDLVVSFYSQSPSGLMVEYGCGGRQVDDATHQFARYDAPSFWGHRPYAAS